MRKRPVINVLSIVVAMLIAGGCATNATVSPGVRQVLAPTGKLRAGYYPGSPTSMIKDASGEIKGVGYDLGSELAARLGIPFEPVVFERNAQVLDAVKSGRIDITLTNATPARTKDMDFTPPLFQVELGFLLPPNSKITVMADVDRPGIRVGVSEGSTSEGALSRELKNAVVVRAPTLKNAIDMLSSGKIDAFATNKAILFEMSDELAGSRVLRERWGLENFAMGIPKGRELAMPFLGQFVDGAKADGIVGRAIERAGLRGTLGEVSR